MDCAGQGVNSLCPVFLFVATLKGKEMFDERVSLPGIVNDLRVNKQERHFLYGDPSNAIILHITPMKNFVVSSYGRIIGYVDTSVSRVYINSNGNIRWSNDKGNLLSKANQVPTSEVASRVIGEAESTVKWLDAMGGFQFISSCMRDLLVSPLDSYCSGNCIKGTRVYTRKFMPSGSTTANHFISLPDLHWAQDRYRAVAWAACVQSRLKNA
jgi:hypothetical protein